MALHELATNALKYGSISAPEGQVRLTWNVAQDGQGDRCMNLLWQESGGPPVCEPKTVGFGTRLIGKTFGHESGGKARLDYGPTVCAAFSSCHSQIRGRRRS